LAKAVIEKNGRKVDATKANFGDINNTGKEIATLL
jgi:hypothetical protein